MATLLIAPALLGAAQPAGAAGWTPQDPLTAFDAAAQDNYGRVAISGFGSTAIVGAYNKTIDGKAAAGAAYVYIDNAGTWTFQAQLIPTDSAAGDAFGTSVSITKDGSTVVVGAARKTVAGKTEAGTAYVFTRNGAVWTQTAELTAPQVGTGNGFGTAVAINGIATRIGVAAPARSAASQLRAGAVFVFKRVGSAWNPDGVLTEAVPHQDDFFGAAVVAKETQILASSPYHANTDGTKGVVLGFDDPDGTYVQKTELTAGAGNRRDQFGTSLSLSGAALAVGAPEHKIDGTRKGAAYVFTHSDKTGIWTQRAVLTTPDGGKADNFGVSVSISGTTLVVGDTTHRVGSHASQGAVYVFTGAAANWTQQAALTTSDGTSGFGQVVAASATTVMVGSPFHTVGSLAGAGLVYVFETS